MRSLALFLLLWIVLPAQAQSENSLVNPTFGDICRYEEGVILVGARSGEIYHTPNLTFFESSGWTVTPGTTVTFALDNIESDLHIAYWVFEEGFAFVEDYTADATPLTYTFEKADEETMLTFYIENDWQENFAETKRITADLWVICGESDMEGLNPVRLEGWNNTLHSSPEILTLSEDSILYTDADLSEESEITIGAGSQLAILSTPSRGVYEVRLSSGETGFVDNGTVTENSFAAEREVTCPGGDLPALFTWGEMGYPSYGFGNSTLREAPGGAAIMDIPEGELFLVLGSGECTTNGTMWFWVSYRDQVGYISQGNDANGYWVSRWDE